MVELMRKSANTTKQQPHNAIILDSCVVKVSKDWFAVIGTYEKP